MNYEDIVYEVEGPVATLTLNRPQTLNALTRLMLAEIRHALDASEQNPDVVGTVLTGSGRGFCSGLDMKALGAISEAGEIGEDSFPHLEANPGNPDDDPNFRQAASFLLGLRKPLIAAVNGPCAGLGFSYATFCDMRFVDSTAKFVTSFAPRGLVAEHGTSWMLPRLVGPSHALDLMWSSRRLEADEAFRIGYANRLCEPGKSVADAQAYLAQLANTSAPWSLMMMKRQIYRDLNRELGEALTETTQWMQESVAREDFAEGVRSFIEKRAPRFTPVSSRNESDPD